MGGDADCLANLDGDSCLPLIDQTRTRRPASQAPVHPDVSSPLGHQDNVRRMEFIPHIFVCGFIPADARPELADCIGIALSFRANVT